MKAQVSKNGNGPPAHLSGNGPLAHLSYGIENGADEPILKLWALNLLVVTFRDFDL